MCVDYRKLNRYPLPLIEDQLDCLGRGKIVTSLDMSSGFYHILINPESAHKIAFITPDGHYEYLRISFNLVKATVVFQKALNKVLGDFKNIVSLDYYY